MKKCLLCGGEIDPHSKRKKYCSEYCLFEHQKQKRRVLKDKIKVKCKYCKKYFETVHSKKIYCSMECYENDKRKMD
jgi:hypothetical protein